MFITPEWTWGTTLSLALPLVLVSLTGQFLPGMAILHLSGYRTPARPIIAATSLASTRGRVFRRHHHRCRGHHRRAVHGQGCARDPAKCYVAGIANGVFYLIGGTFAGTIVMVFTALPKEFIAVLAGLALIGAIAANITAVVREEDHREASVITFLATASGMRFLGLGSAFWGVVIGGFAYLVLNKA